MRRGLRAAALVMALVLLLGTVAAATDTTETTGSIYDAANVAKKNGIQVAPLDGCTVEFAEGSEMLNVTYKNTSLKENDMVIVLLLKSSEAVTDSDKAEKVATTLTKETIQYIDQADVTGEDHTVEFTVFPQNYSNGVIRLIWKSPDSDGVNTATVAAVNRTYTLGDVNDDGNINILDVAATLYYYVGRSSGDNINLLAADVNGDNSVNILDVAAILYYYAKDIPFTRSN